MPDSLTWSRHHKGYMASCGEEGQGVVSVWPYRQTDGTTLWGWAVDMLPADAEPSIIGNAATADQAKAAAELQVLEWPLLIEGARRHEKETPSVPTTTSLRLAALIKDRASAVLAPTQSVISRENWPPDLQVVFWNAVSYRAQLLAEEARKNG